MDSVASDGKPKYGAYVWMTYETCGTMRDQLGSAIVHENLAPPNADGVSVAHPPARAARGVRGPF